MKYQLTALEARVIGCLLEKQVTTPEQYPLSVNGVVTACNQKTNREPVMNLSESEVQEQLDNLVKRHYLRTVSGFGNRVTKYEQRFCNSEFGDLKLSAAEVALITTLLLRGAQTPGELRFLTYKLVSGPYADANCVILLASQAYAQRVKNVSFVIGLWNAVPFAI